MTILKIEKPLEIEGIQVRIEWSKFFIGTSFFVPCIAHDRLATRIALYAENRGYKVKIISRIENQMWGIRVWRIA